MSTELQTAQQHTFFDIFSATFSVENETIKLNSIVIPKIQRDYAQGRTEAGVTRVRNRFLAALKKAIKEENITLDFIYGDVDESGRMTPLDGQQRLTTLFLLHVYAAKKEQIDLEEYGFLNKFSYETRYSARDFCTFLVNSYTPTFTRSLTEEIIDQPWFPLDWKNDPTISSMLVMLDAIHDCFSDVPNIWRRLKEGAISFYFLLIKDMGLTDELYIKMNSRGKPLTQFEHFKAELEHNLREVNERLARVVAEKIDTDWTYMLWQYRNSDNIIDDEFLRYFRFVCDIICYQSGGTPQGKSNDEFDLLSEYFSKEAKEVVANVHKLVALFDCWCDLEGITPSELMARFIAGTHENNKIKLDSVDIFKECLKSYADVRGNGIRKFPLNRIVLLFAFVTYLQNKSTLTEADFSRRLRIVNNLLLNSVDELSDSVHRSSGNRMPAILTQVEKIITLGLESAPSEKALNATQFREEQEKETWLKEHQDNADALFELEDHELLHGQVSIVGLDDPDLFPRFKTLYDCDWDLVDQALMTIGLYAQKETGKRHQLGSSAPRQTTAWRNLFHKSKSNSDGSFDKTKQILCTLLSKTPNFTNDYLKDLVKTYTAACETQSVFPVQYYYIKYPHFRPGSYGKYNWENRFQKPYEMLVLLTQSNPSENSYQPFLKTVDDQHLSREYKGRHIVLENVYISCINNAYVVYRNDNDEEIYRIDIVQNEDGIDTENRIEKLKKLYRDILDLNNNLVL